MGKKSRNAGKVERRQAAGGGAHHKRKDEYRILTEDLDKFNETARALALDDEHGLHEARQTVSAAISGMRRLRRFRGQFLLLLGGVPARALG